MNPCSSASRSQITDAFSRTSALSHASITPVNGSITRGCVPFRGVPAPGGAAGASPARYFFTVRQSQPVSAAISAYVTAPASSRPRYFLMSIQCSGCVIIEEITLRFIALAVDKAKGDPS